MSIITWQEVVEQHLAYLGRAGYPLSQIKYYLENDTIQSPDSKTYDIVEKSKLMNYEQVCELIDGYLKLKPSYIRVFVATSLDDEVLISFESGRPAESIQTPFGLAGSLDTKIKII